MNECLMKPPAQNKNVSTIFEFLIQVDLYHKAVSICSFYFMFLYPKNLYLFYLKNIRVFFFFKRGFVLCVSFLRSSDVVN